MVKKLILVLLTSILFITGCQNVNSVNLNQMIINNSKVKSTESNMSTSFELTYNRAKVQDKDLLKTLDLLNHTKFIVHTKMQDNNTVSLSGEIILKQGKIPFKSYIDKKAMVLLLDNATKPIRIPMTSETSQSDQWIQDFQTEIIDPVVRNLPNPKHISVWTKTDKVNGVKINGFNVHAEVYATEAPNLLITFINNLLKDEKAISQIVDAVNKLNKVTGDNSTISASEFKDGLEQFKTIINESIPDLKQSKLLTTKNYFKTNIFVDQKFYQRKSSSVLNLENMPDDTGLTGIRLNIVTQNWNINRPIKADKISYSKYLNENASPEEILATLDKKRSVLYSGRTSFIYKQSTPLKSTQVYVSNNKRKVDWVTVKGIAKGDIIKVYKTQTGSILFESKQATGPNITMSIPQLGTKSGKIYVSIIRSHMAESSRVGVAFKGEK